MTDIAQDRHRSAAEARALDTMVRAALLRAGREDANLQDRIDCAELAVAAGEHAAARMLYTMVFLRMGFAADALAEQEAMALASGLWDEGLRRVAVASEPLPPFSVERAIVELRGLIALALPADEPGAEEQAVVVAAPSGSAVLLRDDGDDGFDLGAAKILADLTNALAEPWEATAAPLTDLCNRLHGRLVEGASIDAREHVQASIAHLAAIVALADVQRFLRDNYALTYAPGGSPRLLHAAARLSRGGLGPYFTNVRHIIRTVRDLFALVATAAPSEAARPALYDAWAAPLASHLDHHQLLDFVDELADRGMRTSLWSLFRTRARRRSIWQDYGLLQKLRDGALDLGDWLLAITAQEMIVRVAAHDPGERRVLGTILASAGEMNRAEQVLDDYLSAAPADLGAAEWLTAVRAGNIADVEIIGGLCTPEHRKRLRFALWQPEREPQLYASAA